MAAKPADYAARTAVAERSAARSAAEAAQSSAESAAIAAERARCSAINAAACKTGRMALAQDWIESGTPAAEAIAQLNAFGPNPLLAIPAEQPTPADYPLSGPPVRT